MKRNLSHIDIPFPQNLMSSSRNATNMPTAFAREIRNMLASKSGAGSKRGGFITHGVELIGEDIRTLISYVPVGGVMELLAVTASGKIYKQGENEWHEIYAGLSPDGHVRYTHFAGKLILCNGIDDVISYDGNTCVPLFQWVQSLDDNPTYVDSKTFSVESELSLYPVGKKIRVRDSNGNEAISAIESRSEEGDTIHVVLQEEIVNTDITEIALQEKPPKFQTVYAAHDRLWGFGAGALSGSQFSNNAERTFVFYTHGVNDERAWRNDVGALQYINFSDKMPASDEIVAMAVKDNLTLFFMRNHVQVWNGVDPTATGDMQWSKTIALGVAHGDLVASLPNDVAFFTRSGVRTLSRMLQTEQLDVSDVGSEIDPSLSNAMQTVLDDLELYRHHVMPLRFDAQGWYGFKVGSKCFVFQMGMLATGWVLFDGLFETMTAATNAHDGSLIIASGSKCYSYDQSVFSDAGQPIETMWWTPWIGARNTKRWANKYVEVISEQGIPIQLNIQRYKNYNSGSYIETSVSVQKKEDYWDASQWDDAYWDYGFSEPEKKRDHFACDTFSYAVSSLSTQGPLTIYGLKLYGVKEK